MTQQDWDNPYTPRAEYVQCKELRGQLRMNFVSNAKEDLTVVLDRSNVELMRQIMLMYSNDLIDLDAQESPSVCGASLQYDALVLNG